MKYSKTKKILCVVLASVMILSIAGCKKKSKAKETEESDITPTPIPVATTTTAAPTLPIYSGPLNSGDIEVTWTETEMDATVKYAVVTAGEFLNVRKGPNTDYEAVGTLTRNQQVVVVAYTSDGWYKTQDGFYVSGNFLADTPST